MEITFRTQDIPELRHWAQTRNIQVHTEHLYTDISYDPPRSYTEVYIEGKDYEKFCLWKGDVKVSLYESAVASVAYCLLRKEIIWVNERLSKLHYIPLYDSPDRDESIELPPETVDLIKEREQLLELKERAEKQLDDLSKLMESRRR